MALNLLGLWPDVFDPEAEAVAAMLATHAAIALIAEDKQLQFQSAMASRDTIGQARGIIMERCAVEAVRAFASLTKVSQNTNTPVAAVTADIIARGLTGPTAKPTASVIRAVQRDSTNCERLLRLGSEAGRYRRQTWRMRYWMNGAS